LWRNGVTGENYIYFMNGLQVASEGYLAREPDQNWIISGTGDYNHDGKSDILWRNSQTGENYIYLMNGTALLPSSGYVRREANQEWQPVYGSQLRLLGDSLPNRLMGTA